MTSKAARIIEFYKSLEIDRRLPEGIGLLNPYGHADVMEVVGSFYRKYTPDRRLVAILGINPGRFGAGVTGIPFTDPVMLERKCSIPNDFEKRPELSSTFVYEFIDAFGGPEEFYGKFFLSAVCPLGFTRDGKNLNYYDDRGLERMLTPFIEQTLKAQLDLGLSEEVCICLGEGKNYDYLRKYNEKLQLFREIVPLPHPRFVMQYRRKLKDDYINTYVGLLRKVSV